MFSCFRRAHRKSRAHYYNRYCAPYYIIITIHGCLSARCSENINNNFNPSTIGNKRFNSALREHTLRVRIPTIIL